MNCALCIDMRALLISPRPINTRRALSRLPCVGRTASRSPSRPFLTKSTPYFLADSEIFTNFVAQTAQKPRSRAKRAASRHFEKRLSALILDHWEFSQNFKSKSRIEQRWMPCGYVLSATAIAPPWSRAEAILHI